MIHQTDDELDALDAKLASQIGDDVAVIFNHEYLFKQSRAAMDALRSRLTAANARADRAEAALAAQIEADARIADDYVAMRERQIAEERAKALLRVDVRQIMRWQAGKVQAAAIAAAIRNQLHDRAALAASQPASVTPADAMKVPEVQAMVEAARKLEENLGVKGVDVGSLRVDLYRALAALEAAPHVNETPESEHVSADVLTAQPAPVTPAEALRVPEVLAMAEALRELLIAADGESYAQYSSALEAAAAALRAIKEGE